MAQQFADSNRSNLLVIEEVEFGVVPANGKPRAQRHTGSKVAPKKETKVSEEIRADRMVPDIIETGASTDGDLNGEYSLFSNDTYLEAVLMGRFTRPMTGDRWRGRSVSIVANNQVRVVGDDLTKYLSNGRRAKLEGFLDEANNRYVQISNVVYDPVTKVSTVTVTPAALVVEAGTKFSTLADANDVIVLGATNIRAGNGGESAFDSNGANAFAAAVAANAIRPGQRIFVEGLGVASGTFTFADQPAAGETVSVNDGTKAVVFQFGGAKAPGVTLLELGADADATAAVLAKAIQVARSQNQIELGVSVADEVVTVRNPHGGVGGLISNSPNVTVVDFAGGVSTARGFFVVVEATADKITVFPNPGVAAAGAPVTIKGSMLRNPSVANQIQGKSYTLETGFEDVNQYFLSSGLRVDTVEVSLSAGEIVGFNVKFLGTESKRLPLMASKLGAGPYQVLKATETSIVNATANVGTVTKDNVALTTALKAVNFTIGSNLRAQPAVGSKFALGIGAGRISLSGKSSAYFQNGDLFDDFINHETTSLAYPLRDVDQNVVFWTLPALKLTSDPVSPEAGNQDVMEEIDFEGMRDPETECMVQIDRFSSVRPVTA